MNDFNANLIAEFRANGGKVTGQFANASLLLLTTTGSKSGLPRTVPLVYFRDNDRLVIIGSKRGAPTNPDWYHNILANPVVKVEVGTESFEAKAVVIEGEERELIFAEVIKQLPGFGEYQQKTTRKLPVIILER
jgi:deazaflavin-dependent oxidoreductase (nitroreductase family)